MTYQDIINFRQFYPNFAQGGMPTQPQLISLAEAGFDQVINIATFSPGRSLLGERAIVQSLGMRYHHIPVVWEDPRPQQYFQMQTLLNANKAGKTFVHCHLNYRVSVFFYLYRLRNLGAEERAAWQDMTAIWTPDPVWGALILQVMSRQS